MAEKTMNGQWSQERIWEWYNARPWIRGCNFMGSDVVNWLDMWQEQGFEEKLKTAEEEIALAAKTGFNAIRTLLDYVVWREQHDGFLERLDRFLDVIYKYGIRAVLVLGNDCSVPRDNPYSQLRPGEQKFDWGYHGGRKNSQHSTLNKKPGYWLIDDEPERVYEWVREIITRYKDDDRVLIWDLYNEPGSGMRSPSPTFSAFLRLPGKWILSSRLPPVHGASVKWMNLCAGWSNLLWITRILSRITAMPCIPQMYRSSEN